MHISLIGMSNIGKSHWARRLAAEAGYEWIECDDLIETRLKKELAAQGLSGLSGVAAWMGQPYEPRYAETSQKYRACERTVMLDVIARLRSGATRPFVIDTTGSVIYAGPDIGEQLKNLTHIIYFEASRGHVAKHFKDYIAHPKPVVWGDSFAPQRGEEPRDALKRCYPDLLDYRAARYHELAHIRVPYESHRSASADWRHFLTKDRAAAE